MVNEADTSECSSVESVKIVDIKCYHSKKKLVDFIKCAKCYGNFHPKCMGQSATSKSAICKHEMNTDKKLSEFMEVQSQNKILSIENLYLKELLKEVQEKNRILTENNNLLKERIYQVESQSKKITKGTDNQVAKKVNKENGNLADKKQLNSFNQKSVSTSTYAGTLELPTVKINQHNLGVLPSQDNIQITPET